MCVNGKIKRYSHWITIYLTSSADNSREMKHIVDSMNRKIIPRLKIIGVSGEAQHNMQNVSLDEEQTPIIYHETVSFCCSRSVQPRVGMGTNGQIIDKNNLSIGGRLQALHHVSADKAAASCDEMGFEIHGTNIEGV
jgi:hypothetical protein